MPGGRGRGHDRGDGEAVGRRRAASPRSARATARSTRSTWRCGPRSNGRYPALERIHLTDFKVRVLDGGAATGAVVRVLIDSTDGERRVDDRRRRHEHHRGVVAGAGRLARLRPAPHRAKLESVVDGRPRVRPPLADRQAPRLQSPPWSGDQWLADRPGELAGRQPLGPRLGYPGPDQGYVLKLAHRFEPTAGAGRGRARPTT